MRAWVVREPGPLARFEPQELPTPEPGPGEVLVRIHAAGINPIDLKTKQGWGFSHLLGPTPWVLGWDLAGEVVSLGPDATRFQHGDAVLGLVRFPQLGGCYAEFAAVPEVDLCLRPPNLGVLEAAGLPLAGLTAWQCFDDPAIAALARQAKTVLVVGAGGGVGHLLVGLGVLRGAEVWGTGSQQSRERTMGLGASGYLAYDDASENATPFDAIIDAVGDSAMEPLWGYLRNGGRVIRLVGGDVSAAGTLRQPSVKRLLVTPDGRALSELAGLVADGRLPLRLEKIFRMDEINEAHELLARGRSAGKIVLRADF